LVQIEVCDWNDTLIAQGEVVGVNN
jgi:hypothetical protein